MSSASSAPKPSVALIRNDGTDKVPAVPALDAESSESIKKKISLLEARIERYEADYEKLSATISADDRRLLLQAIISRSAELNALRAILAGEGRPVTTNASATGAATTASSEEGSY
jgi:hypothetical protein